MIHKIKCLFIIHSNEITYFISNYDNDGILGNIFLHKQHVLGNL